MQFFGDAEKTERDVAENASSILGILTVTLVIAFVATPTSEVGQQAAAYLKSADFEGFYSFVRTCILSGIEGGK